MSKPDKKYKYINIKKVTVHPKRITADYVIETKYGIEIGKINYYSRWRQHCFMPGFNTVWSAGCLKDVINFMELISEKQKNQKADRE